MVIWAGDFNPTLQLYLSAIHFLYSRIFLSSSCGRTIAMKYMCMLQNYRKGVITIHTDTWHKGSRRFALSLLALAPTWYAKKIPCFKKTRDYGVDKDYLLMFRSSSSFLIVKSSLSPKYSLYFLMASAESFLPFTVNSLFLYSTL